MGRARIPARRVLAALEGTPPKYWILETGYTSRLNDRPPALTHGKAVCTWDPLAESAQRGTPRTESRKTCSAFHMFRGSGVTSDAAWDLIQYVRRTASLSTGALVVKGGALPQIVDDLNADPYCAELSMGSLYVLTIMQDPKSAGYVALAVFDAESG